MKAFKKTLPAILMILAGIAIGIMLIIDAVKLTEVIFRIFGVALVVLAVVLAIRYLIDRRDGEANMSPLVTAVIAFIIGMVLAFAAKAIVEAGSMICAIFYGAVMIVSGIFKISQYISLKKQGAAASAIIVFSGLLALALGVVAIIFCGQALKVLGIVIGISLIVQCVLDIISLVVVHRAGKKGLSIYDTSGDDKDYDLE